MLLFLNELSHHLNPAIMEHVTVDTGAERELIINFNVSFPKRSCEITHLDVVDKAGEMYLDLHKGVYKQSLNQYGDTMGSVIAADKSADATGSVGCRMWGSVNVNKVAGNLHWAIGSSSMRNSKQHSHSFGVAEAQAFDNSYEIHDFWFGDPTDSKSNRPLDGHRQDFDGIWHIEYHIQVVPTTFTDASGEVELETNQFTFTKHFHQFLATDSFTEKTIPGLFFYYDLSPFKVQVSPNPRSLLHFTTTCCAIIGGVFTLSGFFDALVYRTFNFFGLKESRT